MYSCNSCHKIYRHAASLYNHTTFDCGKPKRFSCSIPGCPYKSKRHNNVKQHMRLKHVLRSESNIVSPHPSIIC
ncbi:PREDICTED: longitudinals lacking protein, isoforms J/P/Q/S/Z-like [Nicrophorus vespilloides]|uniref:Longitudinals lacking protein, isoforms J/P/Q/S/Z-like n=1 Tax=Nicrophorus vespilloides TaxID=110193 RepID=A0ABM1N9L4_NICVS|nr:PREDICTED: longitudinals lacking protein, isoforms J/P/Q/S/Z-like [Nicrophorus vespilloides]